MVAYVRATGLTARRKGGVWRSGEATVARIVVGSDQVVGARQPGIMAPAGGAIVDAEGRAVLALILGALRSHGLIAT